MPSVNVVNGKQIVVENLNASQRLVRFAAKPFVQMWHHQDLIAAILRREVRDTILHELGHQGGADDAELRDRGL